MIWTASVVLLLAGQPAMYAQLGEFPTRQECEHAANTFAALWLMRLRQDGWRALPRCQVEERGA